LLIFRENNFAIDSLSPARNIGNIEIARLFPVDLDNQSRLDDEEPDSGALEWIPTVKKEKIKPPLRTKAVYLFRVSTYPI
jgi:hypothetical protein